jgi:hypothetical protein
VSFPANTAGGESRFPIWIETVQHAMRFVDLERFLG